MSADTHDPTDVTDAPWDLLNCLLPQRVWHPGGRGRPPAGDVRGIGNGMLSLKKTGCQGRRIPQDCGHWSTSYGSCKRWRHDGVWGTRMETRRQWARRGAGRQAAPAAGSMDAQRLKTAPHSAAIGCDGHKKSTGRQRHLLVDTLGVISAVVVTDARTDERLGLVELLLPDFAAGVKRLRKLGVAGASPAQGLEEGVRGVQHTHKIALASTTHQEGKGFQVVPGRGAVERTFAWRLTDRRQSRDDERVTVNSAAMMQISMIRLLLNRLA
jgi:transposase